MSLSSVVRGDERRGEAKNANDETKLGGTPAVGWLEPPGGGGGGYVPPFEVLLA